MQDLNAGKTDYRLVGVDDNILVWKQLADCKNRFTAMTNAVSWVINTGNFSTTGIKNFGTAMRIDATHTLENAFIGANIIGTICQESGFGTQLGTSANYKGPFQLANIVVTEFNQNNPACPVTFPGDIDDLVDLEMATRVAAWYYANNLRRLTVNSAGLTAVTDITQAAKFAIASYNAGPTVIKTARELTTTPAARNTWDLVKINLENAGVKPAKATEIRNYVINVLAYAARSANCWCANC